MILKAFSNLSVHKESQAIYTPVVPENARNCAAQVSVSILSTAPAEHPLL
jgi:hypothetical protein